MGQFKNKDIPKKGFNLGRCNPCKYAEVINAQDGWTFLGCIHEPYHGKWVAAIKKCPKLESEE